MIKLAFTATACLTQHASHKDHAHGDTDNKHAMVPHGDHMDYLHEGHLHHVHGDHIDEHGKVDVKA